MYNLAVVNVYAAHHVLSHVVYIQRAALHQFGLLYHFLFHMLFACMQFGYEISTHDLNKHVQMLAICDNAHTVSLGVIILKAFC